MAGVTVDDRITIAYNTMKASHKYRFIIMKMTSDFKEIHIEKMVDHSLESWDQFMKELPTNECRFAVYDIMIPTDTGNKDQLVFIFWCPQGADEKMKKMYMANKDGLKMKLFGINGEFQASVPTEMTAEKVTAKIKEGMVH